MYTIHTRDVVSRPRGIALFRGNLALFSVCARRGTVLHGHGRGADPDIYIYIYVLHITSYIQYHHYI